MNPFRSPRRIAVLIGVGPVAAILTAIALALVAPTGIAHDYTQDGRPIVVLAR